MKVQRLSGIDALGRGVANLRANWQLVLVATAGTVAISGMALAGMVPGLALVGLSLRDLASVDPTPEAPGVFPSFDFDPAGLEPAAIATAALVFLAALLAASLVQCWVQAGVLGALWAGDAQSPPGPGRPSIAFRTWSPRFFVAEANRHFFRLLGYYGILLAFVIVWLLLVLGLVLAIAATGEGLDGGAAVAIGCGGAIPLFFILFVLALAASVGQADVPRPDGSALAAVRTGFRVLGSRLGACALLYLIFFAGVVAVATAEGILNFTAGLLLRGSPGVSLMVGGLFFLVQTLVQTALTLALAAALIALVRADHVVAGPTG